MRKLILILLLFWPVFGSGQVPFMLSSEQNTIYLANYELTGTESDVWYDGSYVYATEQFDNIYALNWDTTSFELNNSTTNSGEIAEIYKENEWIYFAKNGELALYTFDGTSWTLQDEYTNQDFWNIYVENDTVYYCEQYFMGMIYNNAGTLSNINYIQTADNWRSIHKLNQRIVVTEEDGNNVELYDMSLNKLDTKPLNGDVGLYSQIKERNGNLYISGNNYIYQYVIEADTLRKVKDYYSANQSGQGIAINNNNLFAADGEFITIYDIQSDTLSHNSTQNTDYLNDIKDLFVDPNNYIFVVVDNEVAVYKFEF